MFLHKKSTSNEVLFFIGAPGGTLLATKFVASVTRLRFFASRGCRRLAQKQPSPVVEKQRFKVVFLSPAHLVRSSPLDTQKKALQTKCFSLLARPAGLELTTF